MTDGTLSALLSLIESAGLTANQRVALRKMLPSGRLGITFKVSGPMAKAKKGDWVKVTYLDGTTDRLYVGGSTRRSLKLWTSERAGNAGGAPLSRERAKELSGIYQKMRGGGIK